MSRGPEYGCLEARLPRGIHIRTEAVVGSDDLRGQAQLEARLSGMSDQELIARDEERRSQLSFPAEESLWRMELEEGHEGEGVRFVPNSLVQVDQQAVS